MEDPLPHVVSTNEPLSYRVRDFDLALKDDVTYGFFGRRGGVSKGGYCSLNCGNGSNDEDTSISSNREIVKKKLGDDVESLLSLYQVHGNACKVVKEPWSDDSRPEADAFVTDIPGVALGILTADCAPVLFSGKKSDGSMVVGAAHAGWGGAFKGVLESCIVKMLVLGVEKNSIKACIGPCIGWDSYEVDEDFFKRFEENDAANVCFFKNSVRSGHYMFDLSGYCAQRLHKSGIKNVFAKDLDTYFNEEDFFSYRRATHRNEKDYGRQISVIMIRK